ncbi:hypothetical protein [Hydrogenimonas sp.]
MKKLQFIALDDTASQSLDMAGLSPKSERIDAQAAGRIPASADPGKVPVFLLTALDEETLKALRSFRGEGFVLFPEPEGNDPAVEAVLKTPLIPVPVRVEALATLAFSGAVRSVELLFSETSTDDFSLGAEDPFEVLRKGMMNRLLFAEGRHLREAVLRIAHRIRSQRSKEGVVYILRIQAKTPLFALDEALDVLEIAVPPEKPLHFAIRFQREEEAQVRIAAFVATPERAASDLQMRIDAQPTYLSKAAVIVESFAAREIEERELDRLCRDNGIDPEDADRLYELVYTRSDETAELIRKLKIAADARERTELVARALAENFIDPHILEELASLFRLDAAAILARTDEIRAKEGR